MSVGDHLKTHDIINGNTINHTRQDIVTPNSMSLLMRNSDVQVSTRQVGQGINLIDSIQKNQRQMESDASIFGLGANVRNNLVVNNLSDFHQSTHNGRNVN